MGRIYPVSQVRPPTTTDDVEMGDTIYERVGISLYNALRFDPEASVRALLAPDTLSPVERKTLATQFTHGRHGLESLIISELTNPLVLAGAAMSFRWPILDPSKYRNAANTLKQYERWIPGPLRGLLGLNEVFVGTPIPQIAARIPAEADNFMHRHFDQVGQGIMAWRKAAGRKETVIDQIRWSTLADGTFTEEGIKALNNQVKRVNSRLSRHEKLPFLLRKDFNVTPHPHDDFVLDPYRKSVLGVRREIEKNPEGLARMTKFMKSVHKMSPDIKWVETGYFPRVAAQSYKGIADARNKMIEGLINDPDLSGQTVMERTRRFGKATAEVKTNRLIDRGNILPPDITDLNMLPEGSLSGRAKLILSGIRERNMLEGLPPAYSMKFSPVVSSYAWGMGRSYAWSWLGHGDDLIRESQKVLAAERGLGIGPNKTELLRNVFIPQLMGTTTFDQAMKATEWAGLRQAAWARVNNPAAMGGVPSFAVNTMKKFLEEDSLWNPASAGSKISNYFYASTLGANLGSSFQNLLQPLLTTSNVIGLGNTSRGMAKVFGKIPEYLNLRSAGLDETSALRKLFPDFIEAGGELGAITTEVALRESADIARGGLLGVKTLGGKARDLLLAPFRSTELINRLAAFEGGLEQATKFGFGRREALAHATEVVNLTQLWAGGASTPSFLSNWWGPLRQYLTFPAKLLGMTAGSVIPTMTSGGMEFGIGGPFNPGTLGRAILTSATAYEVGKELLDVDLSRSLLFGGLPIPQEQNVLSPINVVPPTIGLAAGLIQDLATGSTENLRRSIPTLVPGGVQLARLSQSYLPKAAKLLNRSYADAEQATPDGMIPIFDPNGNLIGHKDAFQLFLSNIGIPGKLLRPDGQTDVQEVERYFLAQRDKMREMRHQFIEASMDGEIVAAEKIDRQYLESYGSSMDITDRDWNAARMKRVIPRFERIAKSMPLDARDRFLNIAHTSLAGLGTQFLGVDPLMLGKPRRELAEILE